jgi:tRNA modification GTPase
MAEINTHGGRFVTHKVLQLILENGARQANRGEFTLRAFVNGKCDLTRAEAVLDMIEARNEQSLRTANIALSGELSQNIENIREQIINLLARMEVVIEYPDESIPGIPIDEIKQILINTNNSIQRLIENANPTLNQGPRLALIGKPNVGKSSLMNRLLGSDRSIIHESPGTTRDLVGDLMIISGMDVLIMDTAGITHTQDPVEAQGVERSKKYALESDAIFHILDASQPLDQQDLSIFNYLQQNNLTAFTILNKIDLPQQLDEKHVGEFCNDFQKISALSGQGIEKIIEIIKEIVETAREDVEEVVITNQRQLELLGKAQKSVTEAIDNIQVPQDILTIDIRNAAASLGEISGRNVSDDILENIFSHFCVGK